jgi:KipI family sensor histidine kinase inhibitor
MTPPRIVAAGDAALIAEFDDRIDVEVNTYAVALAEHVRAKALRGVKDVVPTFRSVAVYFDPLHTDVDALAATLRSAAPTKEQARSAGVIEVPVCYDPDFGPDLEDIARRAGIDTDSVVSMHTDRDYRVFMLGFMPGFAYLGTVDARIAAPRLSTPRVQVAPGSVGIAGEQTGIYPAQTPGGWNIIGRTPLRTWRPAAERPALFRAGDLVRFLRIDRAAFERIAATQEDAA